MAQRCTTHKCHQLGRSISASKSSCFSQSVYGFKLVSCDVEFPNVCLWVQTPGFSFRIIIVRAPSLCHRSLHDVRVRRTPAGMVTDGSPCDSNMLCYQHSCVPRDSVLTVSCPLGDNGKLCSGNGVRTLHCLRSFPIVNNE